MSQLRVLPNTARLMVVARDKKSRQLHWFLVDPKLRSVVAQGDCPLTTYFDFQVSPDETSAVFHGRRPHGFYRLDLASGEWSQFYQKGYDNLFSISSSPLHFVAPGLAFPLLDEHDAEGFIQDTWIVLFDVGGSKLQRWASLEAIKKQARQALGSAPGELQTGEVTFAGTEGFAFTLRSVVDGQAVEDHLVRFDWALGQEQPSQVTVVESFAGRIIPFDFDPVGGVLYRRRGSGKTSLRLG